MGKNFKYENVPGNFKKRELAPCLDLLVTAGIVHKVFHTAGQGIPIGAQANPNDFKVIFLDVALSQAILGLDAGDWIVDPLEQFINKGEFIEAFVGQELLAYAVSIPKKYLYYWHKEDKETQASPYAYPGLQAWQATEDREVDYLIQKNEHIIPIEVKSGQGTTLKSMHNFLEMHPKTPYGIRCSTQNYSVHGKIYSYPLYAVFAMMQKLATPEVDE